jgi:thymidylate synthase ThyX
MVSRVRPVGLVPPEKLAYALARYSRSADSITQSLDWVATRDAGRFLESFYFDYGHASIADLGHLALCFEGISELAATEIEDEPLWDGQAKSSRYQDFSKMGVISPPELEGAEAAAFRAAAEAAIQAYTLVHERMTGHLAAQLPRPGDMKPDTYQRNIAARAFDVARYLLPFCVPTNVGQVTSIRTLEQQLRRLSASPFAELRELAAETAIAIKAPGAAPTLAKYVSADEHRRGASADLAAWAAAHLKVDSMAVPDVDLLRPADPASEIVATLLYPVTPHPFRALYETVRQWTRARREEVIDVALRSRARYDALLREFRSGPFVYDIVMDIGGYRDLHRHRRCQQHRQEYGWDLGFAEPDAIAEAGLTDLYRGAIGAMRAAASNLPEPARQYLLPFAQRVRCLFKMDFAQAEYIAKLRSGVKGHFSYRRVAWLMRERMIELEPELGRLMQATPPEEQDPLTR